MSTKHDGYEHELPNGDVLVVAATEIRPEVDEAFRRAEAELDREVDAAYERLRRATAA